MPKLEYITIESNRKMIISSMESYGLEARYYPYYTGGFQIVGTGLLDQVESAESVIDKQLEGEYVCMKGA